MSATYRAIQLTARGGPEVLRPVALPLREPAAGDARVRVRATGIGFTDVIMRRGWYPFAPPIPFVPGYEIVGTVDAVGPGVERVRPGQRVAALTVYGGYAEYLYRSADELVPVPDGLDDVQVAAVILNYVTAWQLIHRVARAKPQQTALVTGASGGVGTALLELLSLAGVETFGAASERAAPIVRALGALPLRSRASPLRVQVDSQIAGGVDMAFDGIGGRTLADCVRATRRGGRVLAYGLTGTWSPQGTDRLELGRGLLWLYVLGRLLLRRTSFYGITALYRRDRRPFLEDLPKIFELLGEGRIQPRIAGRVSLADVPGVHAALERGGVDGKFVIVF